MSQGITCYEQDEKQCEEAECLRNGCQIRGEQLNTRYRSPVDARCGVRIVDELRQTAGNLINGTIEDGGISSFMLVDAADEIERLRAALARANDPTTDARNQDLD